MKRTPSILLLALALSAGLMSCDSQAGKTIGGILGSEEPEPEMSVDTVYITKSGACYHRSYDCVARHNPRKVHIDYADSLGRRPCENCMGTGRK